MKQDEAEKLAREIEVERVCCFILSGDYKREIENAVYLGALRNAAFVCDAFAKEQRVYDGPHAVAANAARECASRIRALITPTKMEG